MSLISHVLNFISAFYHSSHIFFFFTSSAFSLKSAFINHRSLPIVREHQIINHVLLFEIKVLAFCNGIIIFIPWTIYFLHEITTNVIKKTLSTLYISVFQLWNKKAYFEAWPYCCFSYLKKDIFPKNLNLQAGASCNCKICCE